MATAHTPSTGWSVNWGGRFGTPKPIEPIRVTGLHEVETFNHYLFGGRADFQGAFQTLTMGATTCSASPALSLALQLRGTAAKVVHWDDDSQRLEVLRDLARRQGLESRIQWVSGTLSDLTNLFGAEAFDYIACDGLLNRSKEPQAVLASLRSLLKPGGGMGVAAHGKYGRYGVHALRQMMRAIVEPSDSTEKKIRLAKDTMASLAPMSWPSLAKEDLPPGVMDGSDHEAILETCFGTDDESYAIDELWDLLEANGLHLIEFERQSRPYYQPFFCYGSDEFREMVERLPLRDRYAAAELVWCLLSEHRFWASTSTAPSARFDDLSAVPSFNRYAKTGGVDWPEFLSRCKDHANLGIRLYGDYQAGMRLAITPLLRAVLERIDGQTTSGRIVESACAAIGVPNEDRDRAAGEFVEFLVSLGALDAILLRGAEASSLPFWGDVEEGRVAVR